MLTPWKLLFGCLALVAAVLPPGHVWASTVACDVQSFGATGDGTTDDTAAINNALAAVSLCRVVIFPPGTYKVTSALVIGGDQLIQGSGKGRTRISSANPTADVFSMTGGTSTGRLTIRDLTIGVLSGMTKSAGRGIVVSGGASYDYQGTTIDNIEILDMIIGIEISGGQFHITNSQIWYASIGIYVHNEENPDAGMNSISHNRVFVGTRTGEGGTRIREGCDTGNVAVYITGSNDTKLTSNWLAGGDYGIYANAISFPVADLKVTANSIEGNCGWALYADAGAYGVLYSTVTGNEITSWGGGIKFTGDANSTGLTLTGNFVAFNTQNYTTAYTGVYVGANYANVSMSSNVLEAPGSNSVGYDVRTNRGVVINGHIIDVATMFASTNVALIQGGGHNHAGLPANVAVGSYATCFDCKSVKDTGFVSGNCLPGGTGNMAFRSASEGGSWICN